MDLSDREDCWKVVLEALALNCPLPRVKQLADKWGLTYEDSVEMLRRVKPSAEMIQGLEIFIKEIFRMEPDEYWQNVAKQILELDILCRELELAHSNDTKS